MATLIIVESPTKAKAIAKYAGRGYFTRATFGHFRDLPKNELGIDVKNGFKPRYHITNRKVVKVLREAVNKADAVILATDPDREGEAIAWHVAQVLKKEFRGKPVARAVFHEITPAAVRKALAHPRELDLHLVAAQQARRILDRLVGYLISPELWRAFRNGPKGLSAGRVQTAALRLIVEREREIQSFVPEEYWSIKAQLAKRTPQRPTFIARLIRIDGKEAELKNKEDADRALAELEKAAYIVTEVKRGTRKKNPAPPFTTSTMQQEASKRLGFTAKKTMMLAQQLYEGIPLGEEGPVGLITYMRTDSVNVAEVAQEEARRFIAERFGEELLPPRPPVYKTKAKGAQEAHEAIRPTSVFRTPESIKQYLTRDQYRLYQLIWRRFVASQMAPAIYDTLSVEILANGDGRARYQFRATGSSLRFPGFLLVYQEARGENAQPEEEEEGISIPPLEKDEPLDLVKLLPEQHFTQPPPRYTEASLVRTLEEYGIGRPSTYASIISTLYARDYVRRDNGRLAPTELGIKVCDYLIERFPGIFDLGFTTRMETEMDSIAAGKVGWTEVVGGFYKELEKALSRPGGVAQ